MNATSTFYKSDKQNMQKLRRNVIFPTGQKALFDAKGNSLVAFLSAATIAIVQMRRAGEFITNHLFGRSYQWRI